jgi:anaerobic magnesium-protoporphyrin IX monomethyl ester cyclase
MNITLLSIDNDVASHGIRAISAYLKLQGYEVNILFLPYGEDINRNYSSKVIRQVLSALKGSDIIGISTMSFTSFRAYKLAKELKKLKKPMVIGGIHATIAPEECLAYFDYVCVGEGEEAFLEFVKKIEQKKDPSGIKNFWSRKKGKIIKNEVRPLMENFDFMPDYEIKRHFILENEEIVPFQERHLENRFLVHTSRGCPHSCTYCSNNFLTALYAHKGKKIRKRSIDSFIKELKLLKRQFPNVNYIWFTDDSFFIRDLDEVKEFKQKYSEINIPFECYVSPLTLNKEKLRLFVEAGLTNVVIGVQTGSERINFDLYKRYMPNKKIIEASKLLHKYSKKINISYHFIITNPYEKDEDILDSINLIISLPKPFMMAIFNLAFFRGTELYDRAKRDGIIKEEKDTAVHLHLYDLKNHLKIKKKNLYLNSVIYWMSGLCTEKRYGFIPYPILKILITKRMIKLANKSKIITYFMNSLFFSMKALYTWIRILRGKRPQI